jgi:hypothetical protein
MSEELEEGLGNLLLRPQNIISTDEMLALHLMHKFNIDRDTIETMPAFEEHLKPLFFQTKED